MLLNLSYPMTFTNHLINSRFMWRGGRNIFMGFNERNVLDTAFSGRLILPWFPVTPDIMLVVERPSLRHKKQ
jgi:hypothetical protein